MLANNAVPDQDGLLEDSPISEVAPASDAALVDLAPSSMVVADVTTLHAPACTVPMSTDRPAAAPNSSTAPAEVLTSLSSKEQVALSNIKSFCSGLLKKLAPPLLREIEAANGVRPGQDPFMPRRHTCSVSSSTFKRSKATAVETVLLKALGIASDELEFSDTSLDQLRGLFNTPLQEKHLWTIAVIFHKSLPLDLGMHPRQWLLSRVCRFWSAPCFSMSRVKLELVSWNVRGLNSPAKRKALREFVDSCKPAILCIQELKLDTVDQFLIMQCCGPAYVGFSYLPAIGTRGGIILAWDSSVVNISNMVCYTNFITGYVAPLEGAPWWLIVVYGPQEDEEKIQFLEELSARRLLCPGPWLAIGDFNLILQATDKNNANLDRRMMSKFRRFIDANGLKELFLHGRMFTWSNEREIPTLTKIDRAFISVNWQLEHSECLLQACPPPLLTIALYISCWMIICSLIGDSALRFSGPSRKGLRRRCERLGRVSRISLILFFGSMSCCTTQLIISRLGGRGRSGTLSSKLQWPIGSFCNLIKPWTSDYCRREKDG